MVEKFSWGVYWDGKEEELVELKLKKRNFILANKDTKEIDNLIKNLEEEIMRIKSNN